MEAWLYDIFIAHLFQQAMLDLDACAAAHHSLKSGQCDADLFCYGVHHVVAFVERGNIQLGLPGQ